MDDLRALLIKHEGLRLKPYLDSVGKETIGVGRNLADLGITEQEAMLMLTNDIERVKREVGVLPWFNSLSSPRQLVVLCMVFNLGLARFLGFQKMIGALIDGRFDAAANEMLNSKWATQVGLRAVELAKIMRLGAV